MAVGPTRAQELGASGFPKFFAALEKSPRGFLLKNEGPKVLADLGLDDLDGQARMDGGQEFFAATSAVENVFVNLEAAVDLSGNRCDLTVLHDRDVNISDDPSVAMSARWREGRMTNVSLRWQNAGKEKDNFTIVFDPKDGHMTGVKIVKNGESLNPMGKELAIVARKALSRDGGVSFENTEPSFVETCAFLARKTGIEGSVFSDGFDVKATLKQFMAEGKIEDTGVIHPVIVKKPVAQ